MAVQADNFILGAEPEIAFLNQSIQRTPTAARLVTQTRLGEATLLTRARVRPDI